jgi:GH35 family endo-1,4-beta-xylanase
MCRVICKIKLFYNDSFKNIDTYENTLLTLKKEEKIHGLGIQCHVSSTDINSVATLNQILTEIENITKKYREYGFEVHYTEIDFNTATLNHTLKDDFFSRLLDIALKYGVSNYTVWGLKDDLSPLNGPGIPPKYPLLLNASYVPNAS